MTKKLINKVNLKKEKVENKLQNKLLRNPLLNKKND
jgi:hypothetical protein